MKSYALVMAASIPLLLVAFDEARSLGLGEYRRWKEAGDVGRAGEQFKTAQAEATKAGRPDPASPLVLAVLGVADPREVPDGGPMSDSTLAKAFEKPFKAEAAVAGFVLAFQDATPPASLPAATLAGAPNVDALAEILDARSKRVAPAEKALAKKFAEGYRVQDPSFRDEVLRLIRPPAPPSYDTALVRMLGGGGEDWITPASARDGNVLVLILKTRDLARGTAVRDRIDRAYRRLTPEQKKKLVTGRFLLVNAADDPRARRGPYFEGQPLDDSGVDLFGPADVPKAFRRAIDVALEVDDKRGGVKVPTIFIVWCNDDAPRQGPGAAPLVGLDRLGTVNVEWIAPSVAMNDDALKDWFNSTNINISRKTDNFADDMIARFFYAR